MTLWPSAYGTHLGVGRPRFHSSLQEQLLYFYIKELLGFGYPQAGLMRLLNPNLPPPGCVPMSKTRRYYTNDSCHLRQPFERKQWVTLWRSRRWHGPGGGSPGLEPAATSSGPRTRQHSSAPIHGALHTTSLPPSNGVAASQMPTRNPPWHTLHPELCLRTTQESISWPGQTHHKACWKLNCADDGMPVLNTIPEKFHWENGS